MLWLIWDFCFLLVKMQDSTYWLSYKVRLCYTCIYYMLKSHVTEVLTKYLLVIGEALLFLAILQSHFFYLECLWMFYTVSDSGRWDERGWNLLDFYVSFPFLTYMMCEMNDGSTYAGVNWISLVAPLSPCKVTQIIPISPPWSKLLHESDIFHLTR